MGLRETLKDKPWIGAVVAAVVLIVALWRPWSGGGASGGRWYYDLSSGDLVAADIKELPPVTLPTGNQGVTAHVYACKDCNSDRFIGYLERYTEQGKQNMGKEWNPAQGGMPPNPAAGIEVAAAPAKGDSPQWVPMMSPAAVSIQNVSSRCPSGKMLTCNP